MCLLLVVEKSGWLCKIEVEAEVLDTQSFCPRHFFRYVSTNPTNFRQYKTYVRNSCPKNFCPILRIKIPYQNITISVVITLNIISNITMMHKNTINNAMLGAYKQKNIFLFIFFEREP